MIGKSEQSSDFGKAPLGLKQLNARLLHSESTDVGAHGTTTKSPERSADVGWVYSMVLANPSQDYGF